MKEKQARVVSMAMKKQEIFDAGEHLWNLHMNLINDYHRLAKTNVMLVGSLKWILGASNIDFEFEPATELQKKKNEGVEIQ